MDCLIAKATEFGLFFFFFKRQKAFKTIAGEYRKTIKMKREGAQGHIHLEHFMNCHMVCVFVAKPLRVWLLISIVFPVCVSFILFYLFAFNFIALFVICPHVWWLFSFYYIVLTEIVILNNCHKTNRLCAEKYGAERNFSPLLPH